MGETGAVSGFASFLVCGGHRPGCLAVVRAEDDVDMFADACNNAVKSFEAADLIDGVVQKV